MNSVVGSIDLIWDTQFDTNVCHRAGSALIPERAIVESEYSTEMFNACFDFECAPLTAVASLAPV